MRTNKLLTSSDPIFRYPQIGAPPFLFQRPRNEKFYGAALLFILPGKINLNPTEWSKKSMAFSISSDESEQHLQMTCKLSRARMSCHAMTLCPKRGSVFDGTCSDSRMKCHSTWLRAPLFPGTNQLFCGVSTPDS